MPIMTGLEAPPHILDSSVETMLIMLYSVSNKATVLQTLNECAANSIVNESDWIEIGKRISET